MASYTRAQQQALRSLDFPEGTKVRDRNKYEWRRGGGTGRWWFLVATKFHTQARAISWTEVLKSGPLELWNAETETWTMIETED